MNKHILVTGAAGFVGGALINRLLKNSSECSITGVDNLGDYYDVSLKERRVSLNIDISNTVNNSFKFIKGDISDNDFLTGVFDDEKPDIIVHLAAQAGVRYSVDHPDVYLTSNVMGSFNVFEVCRRYMESGGIIDHLVYASSSSVYGSSREIPFSEDHITDRPSSLYAATKKSTELLAYSYSELYSIPTTGLRFFTVYGPMGRPDMAYYSFAEKLRKGEKIRVFNHGNCERDFTYIDDVTEGIMRVMEKAPVFSKDTDGCLAPPYAIYNIGNSHPEKLMDFIHILAEEMIKIGILKQDFNIDECIELVPKQPGDVPVTYADVSSLEKDFGYRPKTDLRDGLRSFTEWYREYITGLPMNEK